MLKRLPIVRPDIDKDDAGDMVRSISQLIHSHLKQLNRVYQVEAPISLLYSSYHYNAPPYENKALGPVSRRPINYAKTPQAIFRW